MKLNINWTKNDFRKTVESSMVNLQVLSNAVNDFLTIMQKCRTFCSHPYLIHKYKRYKEGLVSSALHYTTQEIVNSATGDYCTLKQAITTFTVLKESTQLYEQFAWLTKKGLYILDPAKIDKNDDEEKYIKTGKFGDVRYKCKKMNEDFFMKKNDATFLNWDELLMILRKAELINAEMWKMRENKEIWNCFPSHAKIVPGVNGMARALLKSLED